MKEFQGKVHNTPFSKLDKKENTPPKKKSIPYPKNNFMSSIINNENNT